MLDVGREEGDGGKLPPGLTLKRIIADSIPLSWPAQRERFGFEDFGQPVAGPSALLA